MHTRLLPILLLLVLLALPACGSREVPPTPPAAEKSGPAGPRGTAPPAPSAGVPARPDVEVTPVISIYNEDIPETQAERIVISEVFLMRDALRMLAETRWDGKRDTPLPISIADFDQEQLRAYLRDEQEDEQELTIPDTLTPLYVEGEGIEQIEALLLSANEEYVSYLEAKGVLPMYLEELKQVLPASLERMHYYPENDPNTDPTSVEALELGERESDHSRLQMNVYPVDIYNRVLLLEASRILGEPPADEAALLDYHRQLRDMAARQLLYHEMTHALQRAYTNLHIPKPEDRRGSGSYLYAEKTLFQDVDTQYHWTWGDPYFAKNYNYDVSGESQAEGISYEVFVALHDMSDTQARAVWDHLFGRLEASREALDEARTIFESRYPEFPPYRFADPLGDVVDQYSDAEGANALWKITFRLIALPAYVGYMHPMRPEDTPKFWTALQAE